MGEGEDPLKPDDQTADLASSEEITQAFQQLTDCELYRILMAATSYRRGSEYDTPDELLNEVIVRTLNGAVEGEGLKRRWKKGVDFVAFLIQTMEGVANDSKENAGRRATLLFEGLAADGTTGEELLGWLGHTALGQQDLAFNAAEAQKDLDRIYDRFKGDHEVECIILGREDGLSASQIQQTFEITKKQYETASRRLRRGFGELFSGK